jgi:hypothetical protein
MKINVMLTIAVMATLNAQAENARSQAQWNVTVYTDGGSLVQVPDLYLAQSTAAKMFAAVGVGIHWRIGAPPNSQLEKEGAVAVRFLDWVPDSVQPGAMAFSLPFEKFHITVMCTRLSWLNRRADLRSMFLAHVLVHEIAHMLQATTVHSDTGVMKARWTEGDYREMTFKPLAFTSADIRLLHAGMAKRSADTAQRSPEAAVSVVSAQ